MKIFSIISLLLIYYSFNLVIAQEDNTPPDIPIIDSVSVHNPDNGQVRISWYPCDSTDVAGYVIYRAFNNVWIIVDTIAPTETTYIDLNAEANFHQELYRMAAFDSSGNISPMTLEGKHHNTLYIFPYQETENCQTLIRLNWNSYINWTEGVNTYKLYCSINYGPFEFLADINGEQSNFKHYNIENSTSYSYYVVAISNSGKTSTSNITRIYIDFESMPTYINAENLTVINNGIELFFSLDISAEVRNYVLERAPAYTDNYVIIKVFNNYPSESIIFFDKINIARRWQYRLVAVDACGNRLVESREMANIALSLSKDRDVEHYISWNRYREWDDGVSNYSIYRIIDDNEPVFIGTSTDTTYTDNIFSFVGPQYRGKFCYFVEAEELYSGINRNPYKSLSNIKCLLQYPRVYMPNSFTPNGDALNSVFMPSLTFISDQNYYFAIFDRWGGLVFKTNNPSEGWDGTSGKKIAKEGTYLYKLIYQDIWGESREKSGYVHLFRHGAY